MGRFPKIEPMAWAMVYALVMPLAVGLVAARVRYEDVQSWLAPLLQVAAILASAGIAVSVPRLSRKAEDARYRDKAYSIAILLKAAVRVEGVHAGVLERDPDLEDASYEGARQRLNLDVIQQAFAGFPSERLPTRGMHHFLMLSGLTANVVAFNKRRQAPADPSGLARYVSGDFRVFHALIEEHVTELAKALGFEQATSADAAKPTGEQGAE